MFSYATLLNRFRFLAALVPVFLVAPRTAEAQQSCRTYGEPRGTSRSLDVGGVVVRSTTNVNTLTADLQINNNANPAACDWHRQATRFAVTHKYDEKRKDGGVASITRYATSNLEHLVYFKGGRLSVSGSGELLHNNSMGIYLQQLYGTTFGIHLYDSTATLESKFDLSLGGGYLAQHFAVGPSATGTGPIVGEAAGVVFSESGISVDEFVRGVFSGSSASYVKGGAGIYFPLLWRKGIAVPAPRVELTIRVFEDYMAAVPVGYKKTYLTMTPGIRIKY